MFDGPWARPGAPKVVVPYVPGMLRGRTSMAVLRQWPTAELIQLPAHDTCAYAELIRGLWSRANGLIICEQDVIPPDGAIAALATCDHEWCGYQITCGGPLLSETFGLVRFAPSLQRRAPDAGVWATTTRRDHKTNVHWQSVDTRFAHQLRARHAGWHDHGAAEHLHEYPARDVDLHA